MNDKPEAPDKPKEATDMVAAAKSFIEEAMRKLDGAKEAMDGVRASVASVNESHKHSDGDVSREELGALKPPNPRLGPKL